MIVKMTCTVEAPDYYTELSFAQLKEWVEDVESRTNSTPPREVSLTVIMGDNGSQRDPAAFLRGIKATWEEERE